VHLGQVGQPRPEAVSRTVPPVMTMRTFTARLASASGRIHLADHDVAPGELGRGPIVTPI
jgi:hypothetical protein